MSQILHVLLTGGVGSRLWPLSRISKPKQYLHIFSKDSLFELAVKRNAAFSDQLVVVGNQGNQHLSAKSLKNLGVEAYTDIVEASPRNTAAAIAFAAFAAQLEDVLLVTPADHIIAEGEAYIQAVENAIALAKKGGIVTFGIQPTKPETGYGYIEYERERVLSFREKPNAETAKDFLRKGNFLWNSGMFCFRAGIYLEELQKYAPEVYNNSLLAWEASKEGRLELEASLKIPSISVDYAVMEKSERIKVVPSNFEWSDMGSFEAVYDYLRELGHAVDPKGNMYIGTKKFTAFIGLENCIFVSTKDADLILSKEASQEVKEVYQNLEKNQSDLIQ